MIPADCPRCERRAVRHPAAYPGDLLASPVQEWACDHCGAALVRLMIPGGSTADRTWRAA